MPPLFSHGNQAWPVSAQPVCHIALSAPLTDTTRSLCPCAITEAAPGPEVRTPPTDSQALQVPALNEMCQRALSASLAKQSIIPNPPDVQSGSLVNFPPNDSHDCRLPSHTMCQSALSEPLANMSSRPGLEDEDVMDGPEVRVPPNDSHPLQVPEFHVVCHRALSGPLATQSILSCSQPRGETQSGFELSVMASPYEGGANVK
jgi:hypothetical protein